MVKKQTVCLAVLVDATVMVEQQDGAACVTGVTGFSFPLTNQFEGFSLSLLQHLKPGMDIGQLLTRQHIL